MILEIWADEIDRGHCRSCGEAISWVTIKKSGKKMPVNGEVVLTRTTTDQETWRPVGTLDTGMTPSHFATCPQSAEWRQKRAT